MPEPDGTLTGRCYTRAQRIPLMIGRLPGANGPLWGGPYTLTQFIVAGAALVVLWQTRIVWAHIGTGWNGTVLLGVPAALAWIVRRARIEGRDPLKAAVGIASFLAAPASGRLAGTTWRPRAGHVAGRSRFFLTSWPDEPVAEAAPAAARLDRVARPVRATALELLLAAARNQPADGATEA